MSKEFKANQNQKLDNQELTDWLDSLDAVVENHGREGAKLILEKLEKRAKDLRVLYSPVPYSPYRNTISQYDQGIYPGDLAIEEKITAILRWNALTMVMKANKNYGGLGGHIASYASFAEVFETGFNHFFKGGDEADLIFYQSQCTTGIYARSFLEGRLTKNHLEHYRQELNEQGLSSYCHPYLMRDYWTFTTSSMGIGLVNAIYQARFMKYLENRNLLKTNKRVWGLFGDGEMDEPESLAGLSIASREKLDNLTFIINCNLQRLDGPVRGNGQIIQELETIFKANGWNVIKVLWGSEWDKIFQQDKDHLLLKRFAKTVDGKYQTLGARDGEYNLKNFFAEDPEVLKLVSSLSKDEIDKLKRGGHDFKKLYAAFNAAVKTKGKPTVILAKTKKGYGMGKAGESKMTNHQQKELNLDALKEFRDRFQLDIPDNKLENMEFYKPDENSEEIKYLKKRREALGGSLPKRSFKEVELVTPKIEKHSNFLFEESDREYSTTTGLVRSLGNIMRDKEFGKRVVPIVADEARTFGMANLFSQIGIYSPEGQLYEPEDATSILKYQESKTGQLLEEGINEAGAISSWLAAATSYSNHNFPMMPFYIFYSMFGFQRIGDLIWAAADQMPRGFLIGATAGRTTLAGEGLQHQDGHSHLLASTIPNCVSYDPTFAYELAVIFRDGLRRMYEKKENVFYPMFDKYTSNKKFNSVQGLFAIHPFFKFMSFARDNGKEVLAYYRSLSFDEKKDYEYTIEELIEMEKDYIKFKTNEKINGRTTKILDFQDMVEEFCENEEMSVASCRNIKVLIVDEAQDSSVIQRKAEEIMSRNVDYFYKAGDPDQSIFEFAGANPDSFHREFADPEIELKEGYRCPRVINEYCKKIISPIWAHYGYERAWKPREELDENGSFSRETVKKWENLV